MKCSQQKLKSFGNVESNQLVDVDYRSPEPPGRERLSAEINGSPGLFSLFAALEMRQNESDPCTPLLA
jgi:hypothetical protein